LAAVGELVGFGCEADSDTARFALFLTRLCRYGGVAGGASSLDRHV
jgi:hypothetical protein